ncbi:efflux RND transporter permease subunit [Flavobacterium sharifuzzamanii]|uniref:efflux RND transporter permease subunit n=1 Tax=Flavobacterium sharifuzzamanii TaxID=2211133 RepID=UPI000DAE8B25|nr:efflux RND transporter permease subunit [Flavobacterium sharifuzzamanii]KAF2080132.1 efflux RND transporter permease subunit [Flavobacterium sharifuzzamanii]
MIKFLLDRPVAVIMIFTAILITGLAVAFQLPVSLMPDVDIPQMTVQITRDQASAQELEKTIISQLRLQLMQTPGLENMVSEAKDGSGKIYLQFDYGTDIDYAFIEVNEKIDAAMRFLPRDVERPNIVKANATDLPVFYINASMKDSLAGPEKFLEFCAFSESYIKKQLEQLPEVAMVDMSGLEHPELYIQSDEEKLESLGLDQDFIQNLLRENNIDIGSLMVRDGFYEYNIRFSSSLTKPKEVEDIWFKTNGAALQLKDIAEVGIRPRDVRGAFLDGNKRAINMAVIKQSKSRMDDLKNKVSKVISQIEKEHPGIAFHVNRDQTFILDYSISNLQQSLWFGIALCSLAMFLFMKDALSPVLIILSVPVALLISMLLFRIFGLSINIISLAGLILAVGNMIDNAIVVIDNINQERELGLTLSDSCRKGTVSVIAPMVSSLLTSCAIFVPLIFLSGISGALFYDQAMAITLGLSASLMVSVTLIPVLYFHFHKNRKTGRLSQILQKYNTINWEGFYDSSFNYFFKYRKWWVVFFCLFLILSFGLFAHIKVYRMPELEKIETMVKIDWNQNIHLSENQKRAQHLLSALKEDYIEANSWIGEQQFIMATENATDFSQCALYLKVKSNDDLVKIKGNLNDFVTHYYPDATVSFSPVKSVLEQLFSSREAPLTAKVSLYGKKGIPPIQDMEKSISTLQNRYAGQGVESVALQEHLLITLKPELLAIYEVSQSKLIEELKKALSKNTIDVLRAKNQYLPIVVSGKEKSVYAIIHSTFITNKNNEEIPLSALVAVSRELDYKTFYGGKEGAFLPINFQNLKSIKGEETLRSIKKAVDASGKKMDVSFTGSLLSGQELLKEMLFVIIMSLMLLYFILAAQFESLTQPLIVMLEIPIDIGAVLLFLYLTGNSLNLMSMTGIIVMTGVIINDSILKIDTINQLRKEGYSLLDAIHEGGRKRFKAILMTSLTSILAVIPMFFNNDIGSQLQKPLAYTITIGMIAGTFVSLYFIPLCYYYLNIKKETEKKTQRR